MKRIRLFWICLLLLIGTAHSQQVRTQFYCDNTIPLGSPITNLAVTNHKIAVTSGPTFSTGRVRLQNDFSSAIIEFLLVVEVFDQEDKRLYSLIAHESMDSKSSAPIFVRHAESLATRIEGGTRFDALTLSPIVSQRCPKSAAITMLFLKFENGTVANYASPTWQREIEVTSITDHSEFANCALPRSNVRSAILQVDAKGTLVSLASEDLDSTDLNCLRTAFSRWEFLPAIQDGVPVDGRLELILVFGPSLKHDLMDSKKSRRNAVAVVMLVPVDSMPAYWDVSFAGNCCIRNSISPHLR